MVVAFALNDRRGRLNHATVPEHQILAVAMIVDMGKIHDIYVNIINKFSSMHRKHLRFICKYLLVSFFKAFNT